MEQVERRLAAIVVIDIVGYSRLVEADEARTLHAVGGFQERLLKPPLARHKGKLVKAMGDGWIMEFASVVSAVAFACDVQSSVGEDGVASDLGQPLTLRIGVNLGDVVVQGDDLLGDGVNVAARLEQLCVPGGVLISGAAHEQLIGKTEALFEFVGEKHLKNINRPVRAYQLSGKGSASPPPERSIDKPVVAILPFANLSSDPEQSYFSDGMTEDVTTELSRFNELMVVAKSSSFGFRNRNADTRAVGQALGAGYLLEGSVRRDRERIRISVQLVEATSGTHLWADRFDRDFREVFSVQEEIARQIVATVAQRVKEDRETVARRRRPEDMRAYDLFLQAHRISDSSDSDAQDRAKVLLEQAMRIDPTYARSYSGLAYIYLNRATDFGVGVRHELDGNRGKALQLAEQALALDPNDPRVQSTFGFMCLTWRDFDRAERHLELARAMNPNDANIQADWAWMQACLGHADRALEAADLASKLNPRYPTWYSHYRARILFQLERYAEAALLLERQTRDHPERHPRDLAWRAAAYGHLGRLDEARDCAAMFVRSLAKAWAGPAGAGPAEYAAWLVHVSYLRQAADEERLRQGLRLAGLPV